MWVSDEHLNLNKNLSGGSGRGGRGEYIERTYVKGVKPNAYDCVQGGRGSSNLAIFMRMYYVDDPKTNISFPLIRTLNVCISGVRNISFSQNFAYVLNEWYVLRINWRLNKQCSQNPIKHLCSSYFPSYFSS